MMSIKNISSISYLSYVFILYVYENSMIFNAMLSSKYLQSYNVLLPNSQDGWWNYKMYNPPLGPDQKEVSTWEYRKSLLRERINLIDADVVCLQEVSPLSFDEDFAFMAELGYEGIQFKKGRFRPATFWMKDRVELATEPMHKDRTLLTSFRLLSVDDDDNENEGIKKEEEESYWHVLNCHLQAGKQGGRRLRQIHEGVTTAFKTAKNKLKGAHRCSSFIRFVVLNSYTFCLHP